MNTNRILYYGFTVVMSVIFLFSAFMYFTKYEMVVGFFEHLGFASWIIYPLAIAKVLGVLAIWTRVNKLLTEWAYAGFFFDSILAYFAHGMAGDGWMGLSIIALISTLLSRYFLDKVYKFKKG